MKKLLIIFLILLASIWQSYTWLHYWRQTHTPVWPNETTVLSGYIIGLPSYHHPGWRFWLSTPKGRYYLSWYGRAPWLKPGSYWRLSVQLKSAAMAPKFWQNWLLQHHAIGAGYVKSKHSYALTGSNFSQWLNIIRWHIRNKIWHALKGQKNLGIILALTLGDRGQISHQEWQLFRATGTSHLVAISGLHLSLISMLAYFIFRGIWSISTLALLFIPAQAIATLGALLAATSYAALAGFAIPVTRAWLMILVGSLAYLNWRKLRYGLAWAIAGLVIFTIAPLTLLSASFWLSFAAVGSLIYAGSGRQIKLSRWFYHWQPHWAIFILLTPWIIYFFGHVSWSSVIANIIAIPWVSFTVVPLALLGTITLFLHSALGQAIFHLCLWAIAVWLAWLKLFIHLPFANQAIQPIGIVQLILAIIGSLMLLAPNAIPGRWLGWVLWLNALNPQF